MRNRLVSLSVGCLAVLFAISPLVAKEVELNGHRFTLPDGFDIELAAGVPHTSRPIAADFDEQGRLYVAESSGSTVKAPQQLIEKSHSIVRLEDSDGDGTFDKHTVFADRMMFPEGTLWYDGSLYVAAPPSIWKLTDTDDDGVADQRSEWFEGKTLTGCANDLHGPYLGPDGWIYWCKGAFAEQTYTLQGKPWTTKASHIFRCRPDGSGIEPVMTGGMDNPVDTAFTPAGERIFTTTFLVNPGNGQRDGIIHAIYGGVSGKQHGVLEGHPRTGELMPVLSHFGAAAPCGLTRYDSNAFGDDYRDNLFACQFNLRKVSRHVLRRSGASYESQDSDFVVSSNLDFHPTDVLEDADGSLLIVDTGGWYKMCCPTTQLWRPDVLGAIYRVRRTGYKPPADPRGRQIDWAKLDLKQLFERLVDSRSAVRQRATLEFAKGRDSAAMTQLLAEYAAGKQQQIDLAMLWALVQVDRPESRVLVRRALSHDDETCRLAALHAVSLTRDAEAFPRLIDLLKSDTPAVRRAAAECLGRIGDRSAVPHLLTAAALVENDRVLEHSIIYALIELADPAATAKALASKSPQEHRAALVALDQMPGGGLQPTDLAPRLSHPDPLVQSTADWIVGHRPEWGGALAGWCQEQLASLADKPTGPGAAQLESKLVQFAGNPAIQNLLATSARQSSLAEPTRQLVLRAMAQSRPKELPTIWADALAETVADGNVALSASAVAAARAVPPQKVVSKKLNDALLRAADDSRHTTQTRLDALAAVQGGLPVVSDAQFELLISSLGTEQPLMIRSPAADALSQAKLSTKQLDRLSAATQSAGPLELDRLLAPFEKTSDERLGLALLSHLKQAKALPSLRIDGVKLRLAKYSPTVQQGVAELHALVNVDIEQQRARIEGLLPAVSSGDVRRGQVVFNSTKAACIACHKFGYVGGLAGPDLTRIGQIRTERDLLESILYPSLSFVRSYEPVVVVTSDGRAINGLIRNETSSEIVLATGPNQEVRLPRGEIDELAPSKLSIMPAGLDKQLTVQELLDLTAFLKNAK